MKKPRYLIGAGVLLAILLAQYVGQPNISEDVDKLIKSKAVPEIASSIEVVIQEINEPEAVEPAEQPMDNEPVGEPVGSIEEPQRYQEHRVVKGESLFLIGQHYGVSVDALKGLNQLTSNEIIIGQLLKIPASRDSQVSIQTASRSSSSSSALNEKDLYWLARIIHAEARGETFEGQVAVGAVVLNRVTSSNFPNSVYGVIFDKWDGKYYQFSPVADGSINLEPNQSALRAAREAMSGVDPSQGALYFYNPSKSTSKWIFDRPIIKKIGKHVFTK